MSSVFIIQEFCQQIWSPSLILLITGDFSKDIHYIITLKRKKILSPSSYLFLTSTKEFINIPNIVYGNCECHLLLLKESCVLQPKQWLPVSLDLHPSDLAGQLVLLVLYF